MNADPPEIEAAFAAFPEASRPALRAARALIDEEAAALGLPPPVAALKWGQPSYVVEAAGTPIRLGVTRAGAPAVFVHCATSLIGDYREMAGRRALVEGNRAALIGPSGAEALRPLIRAALTYKRRRQAAP